jgi:hypothetical protein
MKEFTYMNNITTKTGLAKISIVGATAASATILVAGFASPAMAATGYDSSIHASSGTNSVSAVSALTPAQFDALRNLPNGLASELSDSAAFLLSSGISSVDAASGDVTNNVPDVSTVTGSVPDVSTATGSSITSDAKKLAEKAQTTGSDVTSKVTSSATSAKDLLGEIVGGLGLGTN